MSDYDYSSQQPPPPTSFISGTWDSHDNEWKDNTYNHPFPHSQNRHHSNRPGGNLNVDPNPNLYIHNVPKDATEAELKELFSTFGTVERIRLKVNQKIGPQALYAFITYSSTSEAQLALQRLNGYDMRSRRLRIEFQRSREDESRPVYQPDSEKTGIDLYHNYAQAHPQPRLHPSRGLDVGFRKKRNEFSDIVYPQERHNEEFSSQANLGTYYNTTLPRDNIEPVFKRTRHFERNIINNQFLLNSEKNRYPHEQPEKVNQPLPTPIPNEVVSILLCEILKPLRPDLFEGNYPTAVHTPQASIQYFPNPTDAVSTSIPSNVHLNRHNSEINQDYSQLTTQNSNYTKSSLREPFSHNVCEIVWRGSLVRNGKKRVCVDLCYLKGCHINKVLSHGTTTLNISHRSTWEDLLKKIPSLMCFLRISDTEMLPDGSAVPISIQRSEASKKFFKEHLQYLTDKQRAGVVTLTNNVHLYLIPPETSLFKKFSQELTIIPEGNMIVLGLFIIGSSSLLNSSHESSNNAPTMLLPTKSQTNIDRN